MLSKNLQYRFANDTTQVHVMRRINPMKPLNMRHMHEYYSEPFYSKSRSEVVNTIVAFSDERMWTQQMDLLECRSTCDTLKLDVGELRALCQMMNMSFIVVICSYSMLDDKETYQEVYFGSEDSGKSMQWHF
jgi:hypothetical protein